MIKNIYALLCAFVVSVTVNASDTSSLHYSLAKHGTPKYQADFTHFDYTDPAAIKGGQLKLASQGTFDSLNPFIAKGTPAPYLGFIYDSLMVQSADEAYSLYGLVAESIEIAKDKSWVIFNLRKEARFSDGEPVQADDIAHTLHLLKDKGHPYYQTLYATFNEPEILSPHRIKISFTEADNLELVMIAATLPVFPKHYWESRDFEATTLESPIGSGPYILGEVKPGKSIQYQRNPDYWAKDLPVSKGQYNFDVISIDLYRDSTVLLEALKSGEYDIRIENVSKLWATGYTGSAINEGRLKKEEIPHSNPAGMQAFVMNLRNPLFQDIRVRQALNYAFDFEWTNQSIFYGAYIRSNSFFSNSPLASSGTPSPEELKLLTPFKDIIPESIFTTPFELPESDGSGNNRPNLIKAKKLLEQAGWRVQNNVLVNAEGVPFEFEILIFQPTFERVLNPFVKSLKRLGIKAKIRKVELSQYINKSRTFDFDLIVDSISQSMSPGIEQMQYWHSSTADVQASQNLIGIKNPAIDHLVELLVKAQTVEELITITHALDRVLLHNWYVIPHWHINYHRVAYWDKFSRPEISPLYDRSFMTTLMTWWVKQ